MYNSKTILDLMEHKTLFVTYGLFKYIVLVILCRNKILPGFLCIEKLISCMPLYTSTEHFSYRRRTFPARMFFICPWKLCGACN